MTRDDIIRMAHEVGMILYDDQFTINHGYRNVDVETMKKFAALVAAAEREACAKICDELEKSRYPDASICSAAMWACSEAIRARGQG